MCCRYLPVPVEMGNVLGTASSGGEGREGKECGRLGRKGQRALEGSSSPALAFTTISWRTSRSQRRAVLTIDSKGKRGRELILVFHSQCCPRDPRRRGEAGSSLNGMDQRGGKAAAGSFPGEVPSPGQIIPRRCAIRAQTRTGPKRSV